MHAGSSFKEHVPMFTALLKQVYMDPETIEVRAPLHFAARFSTNALEQAHFFSYARRRHSATRSSKEIHANNTGVHGVLLIVSFPSAALYCLHTGVQREYATRSKDYRARDFQ